MRCRCTWSKVFSGCCVCLASRFRAFRGPVSFSTALSRNLCRLVPGAMTGANCVTHWRKMFEQEGISEPQHSSEHIVSHVLGGKTIHNLAEETLSRPLTTEQKQMIWDLCSRRLQHMPVQYVIEEWDFRDLTLKIKPPVFIPRPETESRAVAVDKSADAVTLTRENAERLCVQHRLQESQLNIISDSQELARVCGSVDVIVSNPPYVFHEDMSGLMPEILRYEDHEALDGGADGMDVIRAILLFAPNVLRDHGKVFLEVDPRHPEMIQNWLQEWPSLRLIYRSTHRDICGKQRFCILQRS
ncbi:MTRF1L release factor glutamine methyltransferase isoform X2 [Heptranchias perlo]|uniref:MTRF1L release factor glutamine methyltransferase isoform X2 n=1 Tax=Heptranchias perlo TaxID=212740 RepID=UPI00355A8AC2